MILDERRKIVNRLAVGMADIQLAYNALASEVIIIFNELSVDHYQDSLIAEVERFKKLAIFRKVKDMNYVPEGEDIELVEEGDNLPFEVLLTETGLPRMPRKDDMVLADGVLYSVHHVKPMNRDYKGLLQLIVYTERTTFIDTLHIYKATLLNPKDLLPISDVKVFLSEVEETEEQNAQPISLGATNDSNEEEQVVEEPQQIVPQAKEVIIDFVWGGKPEFISLDKTQTWIPFKSRIKTTISEEHPILYVKGGMEVIQVIV